MWSGSVVSDWVARAELYKGSTSQSIRTGVRGAFTRVGAGAHVDTRFLGVLDESLSLSEKSESPSEWQQ